MYIRSRKEAADTNCIVKKSYSLHFINKNHYHIIILIW